MLKPVPFHNTFRGKHILVTGHTGFKGSWLCMWLNHLGAHVTGYSLKPPTIPSMFEICALKKKMLSIQGDIREAPFLKKTFHQYKPELVFHLAAQSLVRTSYAHPVETYATNVLGTAHVLEACRQTPSVRAAVIITSDKCYKNPAEAKAHKENEPLGGDDPYSSSKACAEIVTGAYLKSYFHPEDYEKKHRVSLASARGGNVIGGGDWADDRIIPDCIRALSKNKPLRIRYPDAVRPWQHVLELLYGYLLLCDRLYHDGTRFSGAWNFGPDHKTEYTVRWVVDYVKTLWGNSKPWQIDKGLHPHETAFLKLNSAKARTKLGWKPRWNIHRAIEKTVEWYKAYERGENMSDITLKQIEEYEQNIFTRRLKS